MKHEKRNGDSEQVDLVSKGGRHMVGMWSVCGRYVVGKGGQYVVDKGSQYVVGYVVSRAGWYVVGREGDVVSKNLHVVSIIWSVALSFRFMMTIYEIDVSKVE